MAFMQLNIEKIEARRNKLKLTQAGFARLVGISRSHYHQLRTEKKRPTVFVIEKLYFNAQMQLKDIFNFEDRK